MKSSTTGLLASTAIAIILAGALFTTLHNSFEAERLAVSVVPLQVQNQFEAWKTQHHKTYLPGTQENTYRLQVFYQNLKQIQAVNQAQKDYTLAINKFSDLTQEEFLAKFTGNVQSLAGFTATKHKPLQPVNLPEEVDWRTKGVLTAVKNQAHCGSCWSFSSIGSVEALNGINGGKVTQFSEQQLIDCSHSFGNNGCNGGHIFNGVAYIKYNGIETEEHYPYRMEMRQCRANPANTFYRIEDYVVVPDYDNDQLKIAVAQQPVSVGVDATTLKQYKTGIITEGGQEMNHAVLLVGYGTTKEGQKYWIAKNSWGPDWGEKGYFKVVRIDGKGPSPCGISRQNVYPVGKNKVV